MNELLQKHGCANVFTIPEGLKELMADISREVLRDQPAQIFDYIANYLSALMITREHGIMAVKILNDLCDCKPSVSEHLIQLGMEQHEAAMLAQIIKDEVEGFEPVEGKEKVKEAQIIKKILARVALGEEMLANVCQVVRNAYRDYWYRKKLLEKELKIHSEEPWEVAAERTLALYKKTKPSFSELTRATQRIQAAYRGYYIRRNLLRHLKPAAPTANKHPKVALPGPPLDIADSREIDLGPVIKLKVRDENTTDMFDEMVGDSLRLKAITHVEEAKEEVIPPTSVKSTRQMEVRKSVMQTPESSELEPVPPQAFEAEPSEEKQRSRMISVLPDRTDNQPSRAQSQAATVEVSLHKISFAEKPEEIFEDPAIYASTEPEVPEDILTPATETAEADAVEVQEDIPDTPVTEDEDSAPEASIPSSAPETADSTDVEDAEHTAEEGEE